jgi:predicted RNA-binding protein YlqC (UPF0109 family)
MASSEVQLIQYLAQAIVDHPEEVKVTEEVDDDRVIVHLEVGENDLGKVIGREGRVAEAMRSVLRVAAIKDDIRVRLEIGD